MAAGGTSAANGAATMSDSSVATLAPEETGVTGSEESHSMRQSSFAAAGSAVRTWLAQAILQFVALSVGILLSGCSGSDFLSSGFGALEEPKPVQTFGTIGSGSVKVALLLPMSAAGNAGTTAKALKQAAELALFEFNNPDIVLIPKDTQGTAAGATAATQQAIADGVELIVGPLFAQSVAAAGTVARNANIPVVAFSTDSNVAGRGVYLLSFLPNDDIAQIAEYAVGQGKSSFAALLPEDAYGTLAEGVLRQQAAQLRARVAAIEKYAPDGQAMAEAAKRIAAAARGPQPTVSAILMPDGPSALPSLAPILTGNGVDPNKVKFLGSGQWDDPKIGTETALVGGWYAAPDPAGWRAFASRYQSNYGTPPPRIASLAYDAVSLAAALASRQPGQRYTADTLTNPNGFSGVDGVFRFQSNGLNERGLAILEVQPGGGRVIRPAPKSFAARSF